MLLGGLFKTIGQAIVRCRRGAPPSSAYTLLDMQRWAAYWGAPFAFPSRFPTNSLKALRWYLAVPEEQRGAFRAAVFRAYWAQDRDIADEAVLRAICAEAGVDGARAALSAQENEVKQALVAATERAAKAGVFGAPTWVVDGQELFWGQDRIRSSSAR